MILDSLIVFVGLCPVPDCVTYRCEREVGWFRCVYPLTDYFDEQSRIAFAYMRYLEGRVFLDQDIYPIRDMIADQDRVCRLYNMRYYIHHCDVVNAAQSVREFRELLGLDRYYRGDMPAPIP